MPNAVHSPFFQEATITCKDVDRVYIKDRKGFVKYALQYGYDLVPSYTFGDAGVARILYFCVNLYSGLHTN